MKIEYRARGYEVDDEIRRYTETKLAKAVKFLQEPVEVRVSLETKKHRQIADLHVAHRFGVLQAADETGDMRDTVNLAVDKLEKQARRASKKFKDKRRKADRTNGNQWPVEVVEKTSLGGGGRPRIVKSSRLRIKPMGIEEAALSLESSKNDFVVFRDSESNRVNVLYRRKDDNYGLISPE